MGMSRISMVNLLEVKSRQELRQWLIQNHRTETECWVIVKRGRPKDDGTFWYIDAVEEAMCFGWIDSTVKKIDENITRLSQNRNSKVIILQIET